VWDESAEKEEYQMMKEFKVRIVRLEAMRVASTRGFGQNPEEIAWNQILAFAEAKGLLDEPVGHRYFGFNNPSPSPGSPNYGYEQWMTVGPDIEGEGEVAIKEIPSRLYAVTRCEGVGNIGQAWRQLVTWFEDSPYKKPPHFYQGLEELLVPPGVPYEEYVFDLYLPIAE
jgi:effector-binding domain-containing protein